MVKKVIPFILVGILITGMCGCGSRTAQYVDAKESDSEGMMAEGTALDTDESEAETLKLIYVYICGAVNSPGVYAVEAGSRICDLFETAGGLTKEAATDYWNQARVLVDGEMIYVPTEEEAGERTIEDKTVTSSNNKVNINTASKEELMTLPGIGESKALAIISYRQENGRFSSIEELKDISGIKDGVFLKIEEYIVAD